MLLGVTLFPDSEGHSYGGEMGAQLRAADWAGSALGSPESWPMALRAATELALAAEAPSFVTWGEEHAAFFNDALRRLVNPGTAALGRPAREALAPLWTVLGPFACQARAGEAVQAVADLRVAGEHGAEERRFALSLVPLRDESGESGAYAVCVDVTAEHERRLEAERARLRAEDESRARDEFISVASHELRAPLGSILIWSQLLRGETHDAATLERALGMIERSTRTLARLLDDLLDASRAIAGRLQVERAPIDLKTAIVSTVEAERGTASAKKVELGQVLEDKPLRVLGDLRRLQQVVSNLLSNAIKFTPEGGRVALRLAASGTHARIEVSDTGIGLEAGKLAQVFERFRPGEPGRTQTGLGLGLPLARHLVELHGGNITAESPGAGQGSTFVVMLPLLQSTEAIQTPSAPTGPKPRALEGLTILVVDDEEDAREAVSVLLRQAGAAVRSAGSAAEAMEAAGQDDFDLVLSDIAMPIEDGYVLIRRLREQPRTANIPALALTAYTTAEDRARALRAGYDQHLAKPVDPTHLVSAIASLAPPAPPRA
jgi:signal transduction histidine kinase